MGLFENALKYRESLKNNSVHTHLDSKLPNVVVKNDYTPSFKIFDIQRTLLGSNCREDFFSKISLLLLEHLNVSSVSILIPSELDSNMWVMFSPNNSCIDNLNLPWDSSQGILNFMKTYSGVLNIESIKNETDMQDDYDRLVSVNTKAVLPLFNKNELFGVLLIGGKNSLANFSEQENEFLHSIFEIVSMVYPLIFNFERINAELLDFQNEFEILSDVENFQESLLKISSPDEVIDVIRDNFNFLGIESYGVFIEDRQSGDYTLEFFEEKDFLEFKEPGFIIRKNNRLIGFLLKKNSPILVENFSESLVIRDVFGPDRIKKMDAFIIYPFIISGKVIGFITIFKKNESTDISHVDIRMRKIVRFLFSYINKIYDSALITG